ncbi:MAG: SET domain-containing protein-lysine N-methyltransferase [Planctomycetes bacterium]|nr:SET domain-containing protein-lysine N-methyltransferase [Planctomycetota bacterium]
MTDPRQVQGVRLDSPDVYVADTGTAKGRGVFARRDFAAGELVEECPVILLGEPFASLPEEVKKIVFNWMVPDNTTDRHALVLGFGSLYNHANPANMRWEASPQSLAIKFIAVRAIKAGEELTDNYNAVGGGAVWDDDNWFERMKVKPIGDVS